MTGKRKLQHSKVYMSDVFSELAEESLQWQLLEHSPLWRDFLHNKSGINLTITKFFNYARSINCTFGWSLPLHFLAWLHKEFAPMDCHVARNAPCNDDFEMFTQEMNKEMLVAALMRWGLRGFEHVKARGIVLLTPYYPYPLALQKNTEPEYGHRIIKMPSIDIEIIEAKYALLFAQQKLAASDFSSIPL